MKKLIYILAFSFISSLSAQIDIPCADLKLVLDDALKFHKDDKAEKVEYNEWTGITEYKYHITLAWAKKSCIKEYEFEKGKIKSWGEILVMETNNKDSALVQAEIVKKIGRASCRERV